LPDTETIFSSETTGKIRILFEKIPFKYTSLCSDLDVDIKKTLKISKG
jgi:hypothetical protein